MKKRIIEIVLIISLLFNGILGFKYIKNWYNTNDGGDSASTQYEAYNGGGSASTQYEAYNVVDSTNTNTQYEAYNGMFSLIEGEAEVVFVGDSLTARGCWNEFYPDVDIMNRGIGSDVTLGVLKRLDEIISRNPEKIFLMIGINDIALHVDTDEICNNMNSIVEQITKKLPKCDVYIQSILPASDCELETIKGINSEYEKIAELYDNCYYIDCFSRYIDDNGSKIESLYSRDGVHLNGNGYEVWMDEVDKYIYNEWKWFWQ